MYTVSEMASLLHIAPSTLRYYDREGLLPFVQRTDSGVRLFTETDMRWLKMISCLKSAGMSLKDIRFYIQMAMEGDATLAQREAMFVQQKEKLMQQMAELQQTLDVVEYKCWYYKTACEAGSESVMKSLNEEDFPEEFQKTRRYLNQTK